MRGVDGRGGGADVDGREPAGVAVREEVDARAGFFRAAMARMSGSPAAAMPRLRATSSSQISSASRRAASARVAVGERRDVRAHAVERPAQVDGGGPGGEEGGVRVRETGVGGIVAEREPHAPGGGGADERRATDEHRADGVGGVVERREPCGDERMRQPRLVDDFNRDAVGGWPDRASGAAGNVHFETGGWAASTRGATREPAETLQRRMPDFLRPLRHAEIRPGSNAL